MRNRNNDLLQTSVICSVMVDDLLFLIHLSVYVRIIPDRDKGNALKYIAESLDLHGFLVAVWLMVLTC